VCPAETISTSDSPFPVPFLGIARRWVEWSMLVASESMLVGGAVNVSKVKVQRMHDT
jgi:hypothetical protein